jgi:hypothetical protein
MLQWRLDPATGKPAARWCIARPTVEVPTVEPAGASLNFATRTAA